MRPLTICLLVALAVRLAFVLIGFPALESRWHLREDGDGYLPLAQTVRDGRYQDVVRGPVYPVFLTLAGSARAAKIVQALLDTATCLLVWSLTSFLRDRSDGPDLPSRFRTPAVVAAWLWAVYPLAIWRVAFINKEVLLTFLLAAYLALQVRALRGGRGLEWFGAGLVLGLVNLCKPMFLAWPVLLVVVAWRVRVPARYLGLWLLAMVAVIAPWTWRNYQVTGGAFLPVATEKGGVTTFVGNYQPTLGLWEGPGKAQWQAAVAEIEQQHEGASAVELDRVFYHAAWEQVSAHPMRAAALAVRKCGRFWFLSAARRERLAGVLVQGLYLGLAAIGLWRTVLKSARLVPVLLLVFIGYVMLVHALSYADLRFSLIVMPLVCVFAGQIASVRTITS